MAEEAGGRAGWEKPQLGTDGGRATPKKADVSVGQQASASCPGDEDAPSQLGPIDIGLPA